MNPSGQITNSKNPQQIEAVISNDSVNYKNEGDQHKHLAKQILQESANFSNDSKQKAEEAQKLMQAADALERVAQMLRMHAQQIRNGEVEKEKSVSEASKAHEAALQIPIPKDATPETLLDMADKYEQKAKENRGKANDLLVQSEKDMEMSQQLEKQVGMINKKDMKLNELSFKQAAAHNEGLNMVFKKLGIYRLDTEYKAQVEYAQRKAKEQGLPT